VFKSSKTSFKQSSQQGTSTTIQTIKPKSFKQSSRFWTRSKNSNNQAIQQSSRFEARSENSNNQADLGPDPKIQTIKPKIFKQSSRFGPDPKIQTFKPILGLNPKIQTIKPNFPMTISGPVPIRFPLKIQTIKPKVEQHRC
jgi:hypothetical protein